MADPKEIYLEPACCADPYTGRTWAADQPWEHSPECTDHQPATRYVRADLYERALERIEDQEEAHIAQLTELADYARIAVYGQRDLCCHRWLDCTCGIEHARRVPIERGAGDG